MKLNWNFLGGGGCKTKNLPWREYEYFLELHAFICCPHSYAILLHKLTDTHEEIGATEKSPEDPDPDCAINDQ